MIKQNSTTTENLPVDSDSRQKLKNAIIELLKELSVESIESKKIQKLNLRLSLIESCNDMSLTRLSHLQQIFKHYCTHIFRTGKYMTFDRLQYQKVHLTMDRFFFFLRDLELTSMIINEKITDIIDKNVIITLFKKVSSNSSRLTFEQFVTCIEKLAIIYYDEKQVYFQKKIRIKEEKKKKREDYERRKKQKMQSSVKQETNEEKQPQDDENKQEEQQEPKQLNQDLTKKQENDELIKDMMQNQQLEDPNEELKKIIEKNKIQSNQQQQKTQSNPIYTQEMLLTLTKQEKIQYYYRLMKIDNINDYRAKMGELSLPTFLNKPKSAEGKKSAKNEGQIVQKSVQKKMDYSEERQKEQRIQALKEKLNEKKNKEKAMPIPKPKADDKVMNRQIQRKKKMEENKERMNMVKNNKEENDAILQKKKDNRKPDPGNKKKPIPPEFNDKQINWGIMNVSIEQLKLRQYNPQKYCAQDEDDKIYLQQYGVDNNLRIRAGSGMEIRERKSLSIVTNAKKRAAQIQQNEKSIEQNLNKISKKLGQNQVVRNKF